MDDGVAGVPVASAPTPASAPALAPIVASTDVNPSM